MCEVKTLDWDYLTSCAFTPISEPVSVRCTATYSVATSDVLTSDVMF